MYDNDCGVFVAVTQVAQDVETCLHESVQFIWALCGTKLISSLLWRDVASTVRLVTEKREISMILTDLYIDP